MKTIRYLSLIIVVVGFGWSAYAGLTGSFKVATDYIWRGQSFSNHQPAMWGNMQYSNDSGTLLGFTVAHSDATPDHTKPEGLQYTYGKGLENDFYGKQSVSLGGDLSAHVGFLYFYYPYDLGARYGRTYVGFSWKGVTLEVSQWDYKASAILSSQDSMEYRLLFALGPVNFMFLQEEDYFGWGEYSYYQAQTALSAPDSWGLPDDFNIGLTVGHTVYGEEDSAKGGTGTTGYQNVLLSFNRKVDGFDTGIFISKTNRKDFKTQELLNDDTVGFSFGKSF